MKISTQSDHAQVFLCQMVQSLPNQIRKLNGSAPPVLLCANYHKKLNYQFFFSKRLMASDWHSCYKAWHIFFFPVPQKRVIFTAATIGKLGDTTNSMFNYIILSSEEHRLS